MRVVAHAGSYETGREFVREKYPKHFASGAFSVQHNGQGWQKHKWTVLLLK
jgi:hypothetical protein